MLIGASVIYALATSAPMLLGVPVLSWVFGITGGLFVVYGLNK